jgi:hypothetical protein
MFRVVATRQGFHNQRLRERGEVFDLLTNKDGSYRKAYTLEQSIDVQGNPIRGKFKRIEVPAKDGFGRPFAKNGKAVAEHADYAEDLGNVSVSEGPNVGEAIHLGWMYKVPDDTPLGQYPDVLDFWNPKIRLPEPYVASVAPGGVSSRGSAPIKDFEDDKVEVIAPGSKDKVLGTGPRPPGA